MLRQVGNGSRQCIGGDVYLTLPAGIALPALYLLFESFARVLSVNGNEPMGSLPAALPVHLLRILRGINVPREQVAEKAAAKPLAGSLLAARDQVRYLDHPEYHLEVLSRLPKEHWTANVTGIEFEGRAYLLVERKIVETKEWLLRWE